MGQGDNVGIKVFNPTENTGDTNHMTPNKTQNKTIAIVGSHPRTRSAFDFARTDCDVWVFNEALAEPSGWCKRADAVFQMHNPAIWRSPLNRNDPKHYDWLKSGNTPEVIMQERYEDVPKASKYPLEQIQKTLLANFSVKRYFTSSISYAIALAIYRGYTRIELYGVELESNTEYFYQRDCATFWTGLAVGRGVDVYAPVGMFDSPYLYGYEGGANLDREVYKARLAEVEPIKESIQARYTEAQAELHDALKLWDGGADKADEITAAIMGVCELANQYGQADAVISEASRYALKCQTMELISGEYLIVRQEYEQAAAGHKKQAAQATNETAGVAAQMEAAANNIVKEIDKSKRGKMVSLFGNLVIEYINGFAQMGYHNAAVNENMGYIAQLDEMTRAAGGAKSESLLVEAYEKRVQDVTL